MNVDEERKRPRDEEEFEPSDGEGADAALGPLAIDFEIKQGHSEDKTSLRANDRTARFLVDIRAASSRNTMRLSRLLRGEASDEKAYVRLCFELLYANGNPAQMDLSRRHGDHIDVMEPSGASSTRRKISEPIFAVDSRRKDKRTAGGTRVFHSAVHLDTTALSEAVSCELKFSTNMTTRQHDRQNFMWRVTVSASLDGDDVVMATAQTNDFEYVARRLKTPLKKAGAPRREAGEGSPSKPKKKKAAGQHMDMSESESDVEIHDDPTGSLEPRMRRSTRKAAQQCRESVSKFMEGEDVGRPSTGAGLNTTPGMAPVLPVAEGMTLSRTPPGRDGMPMGPVISAQSNATVPTVQSLGLGHQFPLPRGPHQITIPITTQKMTLEDDIMRQPSSGGRNLCRVESIDNLEWRQPRTHVLSEDQDDVDMDLLLRSRGGSEEDLLSLINGTTEGGSLPLLRNNSDGLLLARCVSSDWNVQAVDDALREKDVSPTTLQNA